jgi:pimeloyl-ACP methyl ester carboxylesterase
VQLRFDNPDHVDIVIHNYRWWLGLAEGEQRHVGFEQQLAERPTIAVPTITICSDFDGANADGTAYANRFTGPYEHRILDGIGHNVPQEAPAAFAEAPSNSHVKKPSNREVNHPGSDGGSTLEWRI